MFPRIVALETVAVIASCIIDGRKDSHLRDRTTRESHTRDGRSDRRTHDSRAGDSPKDKLNRRKLE